MIRVFSRYIFLGVFLLFANLSMGQSYLQKVRTNKNLYDSAVSGIHIYPGMWRPVFNTEQIAWISPPWLNKGFIWGDFPKSTEFIWLDFPKAIFTQNELLFLSHINPSLPSAYNYPEIDNVPWKELHGGGIQYNQQLPNGIKFGGSIARQDTNSVDLELWIKNNTDSVLRGVQLLTCAYLAVEEFSEKSNDNKFIHVSGEGWIPLSKALLIKENLGKYRVGWGNGSYLVADWPVIIATSKDTNRIIAYTWWQNTGALWGNPFHPSFNADPLIPDLFPGQEARIRGNIIFFQGSIDQFDIYFHHLLNER